MDAQRTGKIINYLRSKKGLTQKELAAQINVSDKTVSKWERGDGCPDIGTLPALAEALGTDVDSLLKGELKEIDDPNKPITASEIEQLLHSISTEQDTDTSKSLLKNPNCRIKLYDFKRPDLFGKYELRKIFNMFQLLCEKIRNELFNNRTDLLRIQVLSVDQLTNEEYIRSLPQRTFFYTYDYNNAGFTAEVDPCIGKVLLKQDYEKHPELTQNDSDCLKLTYVNHFIQTMQDLIYQNTDKSIPWEEFEKSFSSEINTLLPGSTGQIPGEMCVLVTLEITSDNDGGMVNIQFNYAYFSHLCRKAGLFGKDNTNLQELTDIKSRPHENNVYAEFGRFISDTVNLEPGTILMTSIKYNTPLNVVVDNKVMFTGEVCVADENFAIRIYDEKKENAISYDEEHYIALRLGGTYLPSEKIQRLHEGHIIPLDTTPGKPVSIIKDGISVARGEVLVIDEMYAIKIID
ncbi:FliM/FliN family flagellar motor switch protein [Treponema bryantii]|uniref:FliM/FliN family flagellar motor switch protein n=1 Tax=Treponema bryantii TaxID=163 RepID=UPI002B2F2BB2|nr:hypothetical protein TRBR_18860 [Treponema bryantii]